jgi:hypothetical protein
VDLVLVFIGAAILISIVVALFCISTNIVWGFLFSSSTSPAFVLVCLLDDYHLTGVRWHFTVVLICFSFIAKDVEHFFLYLFTICP